MAAVLTGRLASRTFGARSSLSQLRFHRYFRKIRYRNPWAEQPLIGCDFGLFFDIDGVICRGRSPLPEAPDAFKLLTDRHGKFVIPTIFVTNAGNCLRQLKADQLSEWIGVKVEADQVIMSHSPLKMFQQFLDKHILVSGQGPTEEIARFLGYNKVTTIEALRQCFPSLDMVDHKRRKTAPCAFEKYFPKIDAVIMFGEPVRWETNLQLIIDVLLTNGRPSTEPEEIPYPHLPVLACNVDLMWMAEAPLPRFGHGSFLHCLESLYKKISGYELKYTALVGKPSEITYHHAEHMLQLQARQMGLPGIKKFYCIGDNPDVDIYGANLFNRYLQKVQAKQSASQHHLAQTGINLEWDGNGYMPDDYISIDHLDGEHIGSTSCESILVQTGVYSSNRDFWEGEKRLLMDHQHRDFIMDPDLRKPSYKADNVLDAVRVVFQQEGIEIEGGSIRR